MFVCVLLTSGVAHKWKIACPLYTNSGVDEISSLVSLTSTNVLSKFSF